MPKGPNVLEALELGAWYPGTLGHLQESAKPGSQAVSAQKYDYAPWELLLYIIIERGFDK